MLVKVAAISEKLFMNLQKNCNILKNILSFVILAFLAVTALVLCDRLLL